MNIDNKNNHIHPTAIIGHNVLLGNNNYVGPYCVIDNDTKIGDNNRFESFCSIGSFPESKEYFTKTDFGLVMGNNNVIREFCTINIGTIRNTRIGNNNIMLRNSHFSHDSIMENNVTLSCNVLIGGLSYIMKGVNCGLGSIIHQYSVLGSFSMVGMNSTVTKSSRIEPGNVYIGSPVKLLKQNTIGLERAGIDGEQLFNEEQRYFQLCQKLDY